MFPTKTGDKPFFTNIHKINTALGFKDRKNYGAQIVHYYRGIGSGNLFSKYFGGTISYGIWDDIEEVYLNISSNFRSAEGSDRDLIYLFGYSRGAIVARVVAGLIDIGLLKSECINGFSTLKTAYLYRARVSAGHSLNSNDDAIYMQCLKDLSDKVHPTRVRVKFMGLFDSVLGGFGLSRLAQELNVESSSPASNVDYTLHLIAADERRKLFDVSAFSGHDPNHGHMEQIWMPGSHSDVGGGPGDSKYALLSLLTMLDRIRHKTDLRLDRRALIEECYEKELEFRQFSTLHSLLKFRDPTYAFSSRRKILGNHNSKHELADFLSKSGYLRNGRPVRYQNRYLNPLSSAAIFTDGWPNQTPPRFLNHFGS